MRTFTDPKALPADEFAQQAGAIYETWAPVFKMFVAGLENGIACHTQLNPEAYLAALGKLTGMLGGCMFVVGLSADPNAFVDGFMCNVQTGVEDVLAAAGMPYHVHESDEEECDTRALN